MGTLLAVHPIVPWMSCCPFLFCSPSPVCFALLSPLRRCSMAWAVGTKALDVLFGHARSVDQQFLLICTVWRLGGRGIIGGWRCQRSWMIKDDARACFDWNCCVYYGMSMGCLWPFLGHSVYTLGLLQRWWCILEGLVMNRWCWHMLAVMKW